jgi:hypothetical protein
MIALPEQDFAWKTLSFLVGPEGGESRWVRFYVRKAGGVLSGLTASEKVLSEAKEQNENQIVFAAPPQLLKQKHSAKFLRLEGGPTGPSVSGRVLATNEKGALVPVGLLSVTFTRVDNNTTVTSSTGSEGQFVIALDPGHYKVSGQAKTKWFDISNENDQLYTWELGAFEVVAGPGQNLGDFVFPFGTVNAEALLLQAQAAKGVGTIGSLTGSTKVLEDRPISFIFPGDADYYDMISVHITKGFQWDVNTHEMGHAVYDRITSGGWGGGQHYIDRCYADSLALSEGWASYFSAVVNLSPKDADAHFEYMVPRRAPIQIENIPADVCRGTGSEWRVFGFLWDLYDQNSDGADNLSLDFNKTLKAMNGGSVDSITTFRANLNALITPAEQASVSNIWTQDL